MKNNRHLQVFYKNREVGTLAINNKGLVAFQYSDSWLENGFSISPISLPLSNEVFLPSKYDFDGLFGVFADSLPDAWGRLVFDRMLQKNGIDPNSINVLDRLAIIGSSGMGALEYQPEYSFTSNIATIDVDTLAQECERLMQSLPVEDIDALFNRCGSSGGARPKAFIKLDNEDWIVKFQYRYDLPDSGIREYNYSLLAKKIGINMPETKLFESKISKGYFGIKRFDRPKIHMISAAALLEADFERSSCDYAQLFKLTNYITNGNKNDMQELFRRMCFNVFINNQDDHLKNFSFLYDDVIGRWQLSPAYDLTDTATGYGQHATTVNGKGLDINDEDLLIVGTTAGLSKKFCKEVIDSIHE